MQINILFTLCILNKKAPQRKWKLTERDVPPPFQSQKIVILYADVNESTEYISLHTGRTLKYTIFLHYCSVEGNVEELHLPPIALCELMQCGNITIMRSLQKPICGFANGGGRR